MERCNFLNNYIQETDTKGMRAYAICLHLAFSNITKAKNDWISNRATKAGSSSRLVVGHGVRVRRESLRDSNFSALNPPGDRRTNVRRGRGIRGSFRGSLSLGSRLFILSVHISALKN